MRHRRNCPKAESREVADLRAELARQKWRQKELGPRLGVSQALVSMWLNDVRPMPEDVAENLRTLIGGNLA